MTSQHPGRVKVVLANLGSNGAIPIRPSRINTGIFVSFSVAIAFSASQTWAQDQGVIELRSKIETVLDNTQLNKMDRIQKLRELFDAEEKKLITPSIEKWIQQLGEGDFETRQSAQTKLIATGDHPIEPVTKAAQSGDRERRMRCLAILTVFFKSEELTLIAHELAYGKPGPPWSTSTRRIARRARVEKVLTSSPLCLQWTRLPGEL